MTWATKGSATSTSARSYLLCLNALHQRYHRYVPAHDFIAGKSNVMADNASRRWDLSDSDLLTHFHRSYPQATSWTLHRLTTDMQSAVIGLLLRRPSVPIILRIGTPPRPLPGASGSVSAPPRVYAATCPTSPVIRSPSSCYSPTGTAPAALLPVIGPSALTQWRTPYATWRRRSPEWGPRTLA